MEISRRFFLFGVGALTTLSFARRARAFAERREAPLLIPPDHVTEHLFVDRNGLFYLGRPNMPEIPTWREYFSEYQGLVIDDSLLDDWSLESESELDEVMRDWVWYDYCDQIYVPNALAFHRLREIRFDSDIRPNGNAGWADGVDFIEGFHPGNSSLFARAEDPVAVSLLQARLNELATGLEIVPIDEYTW